MIYLNRLLIRQLRSVLHRGLSLTPRIAAHPVYIDAGPQGLLVRGQTTDTVIEFHAPDDHGTGRIALPWDSLKRLEGTRPDAVTIEFPDSQTAVARWLDRGIPQVEGLPVLDWTESTALHPTQFESNPPRLLTALRDAAEITEPNPSRFSLSCLHLRGGRGQVEATDGGQLLVQSGFTFPWTDDVLVPAGKFFSNRDLPADQPVDAGRAGDWISFQIRPWMIRLRIPKEGRFPQYYLHLACKTGIARAAPSVWGLRVTLDLRIGLQFALWWSMRPGPGVVLCFGLRNEEFNDGCGSAAQT